MTLNCLKYVIAVCEKTIVRQAACCHHRLNSNRVNWPWMETSKLSQNKPFPLISCYLGYLWQWHGAQAMWAVWCDTMLCTGNGTGWAQCTPLPCPALRNGVCVGEGAPLLAFPKPRPGTTLESICSKPPSLGRGQYLKNKQTNKKTWKPRI
jgi:hypothetical protein